MIVCVIRGPNQFSYWMECLTEAGFEVVALAPAEITKMDSSVFDGLVFCNHDGIHVNRTVSLILRNAEEESTPTYPTLNAHLMYNDKVTQIMEFRRLQIPHPQTWIFMDRAEAMNWIKEASFPLIYKTSSGAGSGGVSLVKNAREASALINRAFSRGIRTDQYPPEVKMPRTRALLRYLVSETEFALITPIRNFVMKHSTLRSKPYRERDLVFFQHFVPGNDFDYRISVIGNRAFCLKRSNRINDFRASGSNDNDVECRDLPISVLELAFEASEKLGMGDVLFADILIENGYPLLVEVSYITANPHLMFPGYWDQDLVWHEKRMTRFSAMTDDFIETVKHRSTGLSSK